MDALTPANREKVAMFESVTNESNHSQSISLLSSCQWNVEQAVATFFAIHAAGGGSGSGNGNGGGGNTNPNTTAPMPTYSQSPPNSHLLSSPSPPPSSSTSRSASSSSFMNRNAATRTNSSSSFNPSASPSPSPSPAPSNASSSASASPPPSRGWPGSGLFGAISRSIWGNRASSSNNQALTPQETFLRDFRSKYGPHVPDFFNGSYADAVKAAKSAGRMLFIYLHCTTHDDTEAFVRGTLCIEQTCNFLRENFVSWAGTIQQADAYKLSQTLGVASFPYIAVLAPQGTVQTVAVVFRHSGPLESDTLIRELLQRMEIHSQITNDIQQTRSAEEAQREQARMLREQQDQEYEESLLMDRGLKEAQEREAREMEELLRISRESAEAEAKRQQQLLEEEAKRQQQLEEERMAKLAALPEEPAGMTDGVVNISFRLPNAKKVSRRFLDSQTIGTVQQYIQSLEDMAPYGDKYQILSNFPRKVHEDPTATLASLKLGKQIQLIVESTAEEEEPQE